jgi:hypothetical protein
VDSIDRPSWRGLLLVLTAVAGLVAAACGGGENTLYPVHGTVYLDGEPAKELAGGTVTFNSSELHRSASGQIEADGTYRLGTLKKHDGAVPGKYRVTVSPPEISEAGERGNRGPAAKPVSFEGPKDVEVTVERRANEIPVQLQRSRTAHVSANPPGSPRITPAEWARRCGPGGCGSLGQNRPGTLVQPNVHAERIRPPRV